MNIIRKIFQDALFARFTICVFYIAINENFAMYIAIKKDIPKISAKDYSLYTSDHIELILQLFALMLFKGIDYVLKQIFSLISANVLFKAIALNTCIPSLRIFHRFILYHFHKFSPPLFAFL